MNLIFGILRLPENYAGSGAQVQSIRDIPDHRCLPNFSVKNYKLNMISKLLSKDLQLQSTLSELIPFGGQPG
jgi:hypothetical protein